MKKLILLLALLFACASTPAAKPVVLKHLPLGTTLTIQKKIVPERKTGSVQLGRAQVGDLIMRCNVHAIRELQGEYTLVEAWASFGHLEGAHHEFVAGRTPIAEHNFTNKDGHWLHLFCEPFAKEKDGSSIYSLGRNPAKEELVAALERNGIKVKLGQGAREQDITDLYRAYEAQLRARH